MSKTKSTKEFDTRVEAGEDITDIADYKVVAGHEATRRVNVDLPNSMLRKLDAEADARGITRQSLIKVWLYEKLTAK
jgi:hypothetical protein